MQKDIVFHGKENYIKIDVGFPFDEPIIIRGEKIIKEMIQE
jgi:hypothetical protein